MTTTTATLTGPQLEVIALLAEGHDDEAIGRILYIGASAVRHRIQNANRNLGTLNRPHLVATAFRRGLLPTDQTTDDRERLARALEALAARLRAGEPRSAA